jgi:LPXTG-motif cell wall-anchored protein
MDNVVDNGTRWRTLIGLISMVAGALFLVGTIPGQAAAGPGGPGGNNGTVKVDGEDFDDAPNNEPHVGCVFQVDFYGYDEGQLFADVTFKVQEPTGNEVILEDTDIFIGEDDNSGGGSEAGLDASVTYDLTSVLAGFPQHEQQGWHVKLTVNADGSQGADVKHKTYWVTGCEAPTTSTTSTTSSTTTTSTSTTSTTAPTTTSTSTTSTTAPTTTESTTTSTSTTSTTAPTTTESATTSTSTTSTTEKPTTTESTTTSTSTTSTTAPTTTTTSTTSTTAPTTTTTVLPGSSTTTSVTPSAAPPSSTPPSVRQLPATGSDNDGLLAAAGIALLIGGAALFASTKVARPQS